jgi:hypothetical protein
MKTMTRDELIALVERIIRVEDSEEEIDHLIDVLMANVPDPAVTDLIYYHEPSLTPEEIVDKALAYQPIVLPDRSNEKI